jgi:hypothetical protein
MKINWRKIVYNTPQYQTKDVIGEYYIIELLPDEFCRLNE